MVGEDPFKSKRVLRLCSRIDSATASERNEAEVNSQRYRHSVCYTHFYQSNYTLCSLHTAHAIRRVDSIRCYDSITFAKRCKVNTLHGNRQHNSIILLKIERAAGHPPCAYRLQSRTHEIKRILVNFNGVHVQRHSYFFVY